MRRSTIAFAASLATLLLAACSSLKPQTGEVSFRLLWQGKADLDLHVLDPGKGHVGLTFLAAASRDPERYQALAQQMEATGKSPDGESAGILDIDCNADVERTCREPIENIYWPQGQAPRGSYEVWIEYFQDADGSGGEVPYVLEIRRGETVVQRLTGRISLESRKSEPFTYLY
jgi:hypothetical protein